MLAINCCVEMYLCCHCGGMVRFVNDGGMADFITSCITACSVAGASVTEVSLLHRRFDLVASAKRERLVTNAKRK